ncbi:unnamed protein product (macronuclear) [Paramecium tetraurelia]|uniref:Transmembrane protein n=1 Tax=Paramecium tetraurelia TaxID=5888 RepID=A0BDV6_PARTE|nr:uncharacterized protein GSPATT00027753001 [Paramecium tetraurelia]CAK56723.1 unnamed protein product [Paramecium tetraurelia]|eukprot:XP_001424121.1 hypothetical protein (macronuclear) [Paramecium tetraurelia strain d4-2]
MLLENKIQKLDQAALAYLYCISLRKQQVSQIVLSILFYVVVIIGLTLLMLGKFYYTAKNSLQLYFNNQRLNSEVSEHGIKGNEPDHELPGYLPPIMSENESRCSSQQSQQEHNKPIRIKQGQSLQFGRQQQQKDIQKIGLQLSFLGDFKQSNFQKSQLGLNSIKQSYMQVHPINQTVNLVRYSEDGESKIGILKTIKSITYDLAEKELEQLQKEPVISKADYPKIQILYESSQPEIQSYNNELQSRQSKQSNTNLLQQQAPFKDVKTEQSIMPYQQKPVFQKKISWIKILKQLIILMVFSLSVAQFPQQDLKSHIFMIIYILGYTFYQMSLFSLFVAEGLEITTQLREIIAWSLLILLPTSLAILIIHFQIDCFQFMAWLSILIASQKIKYASRNPALFNPFIIILCLSALFC